MRKIICDRCGGEITGSRIGYLAANWRSASDDSLMQDNPYEAMDFCENCMRNILMIIDNKIEADEPEPAEEEPEEPEEDDDAEDPDEDQEDEEEGEKPEPIPKHLPPVTASKGVNLRKLRELVKEGKTAQQIADELGCSVASYYKCRKLAEQMWKEGKL